MGLCTRVHGPRARCVRGASAAVEAGVYAERDVVCSCQGAAVTLHAASCRSAHGLHEAGPIGLADKPLARAQDGSSPSRGQSGCLTFDQQFIHVRFPLTYHRSAPRCRRHVCNLARGAQSLVWASASAFPRPPPSRSCMGRHACSTATARLRSTAECIHPSCLKVLPIAPHYGRDFHGADRIL